MRQGLIPLLSLTLSGCWMGEGLYSDSDARPAFDPGMYRMTMVNESPADVRISTLPTGMTQFQHGGEKASYGMVPLDPKAGKYLAWEKDDQNGDPKAQDYALAVKQANGSFIIYFPTCKDAEADVARAAGAAVGTEAVPTCHFASRASVEQAMRRYQPRELTLSMKLVRVGD